MTIARDPPPRRRRREHAYPAPGYSWWTVERFGQLCETLKHIRYRPYPDPQSGAQKPAHVERGGARRAAGCIFKKPTKS